MNTIISDSDSITTDDAIEKALWEAEDAMNKAQLELRDHVCKTHKIKEIYLALKTQVEYLKRATSIGYSVKIKKRKFDEIFYQEEEEVPTQINVIS